MTDIDFLSLIEEGAERWNQWRIDNPTVQPNLSQAYLFGQDLAGFNLSKINLERACLIGANLRGATLNKAQLQSVYASSADFSAADLSGAALQGSSLGKANFSDANLSGTQAFGTNFSGALFTGAYLCGWHIDETTVLSGLKASHIYLGKPPKQAPKQKPKQATAENVAIESTAQRHPPTGAFKPGALEPFLRLAAVQSAALPTAPSTTSAGPLTASLRHPVTALISSAGKIRDRLQPAALSQTSQRAGKQITQTAVASAIWVTEQAKAIHHSKAVGQLIIAFRPDSIDHVTPGALHQLSPTATDRLKAPVLALLEIEAVKSTLQTTSNQTRQLQQIAQTILSKRLEAIGQSGPWAYVTVLASSPAGRYILSLLEPDGTERVTPGALSPYLESFNAKRIGQTTAQTAAQATAQAARKGRKHLKILFTPDSTERVTVGKLYQLSPDVRQRLELPLAPLQAKSAQLGKVGADTTAAAIYRLKAFGQSAAFAPVVTAWRHSKPIQQVTRHFQPDGVDRVTQGALHGVLHGVSHSGLHRVLRKAIAQHNLGDRTGQLIGKLSNPKHLEAELKKFCDQHPISAGLGATAALVLLLLNFMPQSQSVLGIAAKSRSTGSNSTASNATASNATGPDSTTPAQTAAKVAERPQPAIEVASIAMPCPIGGAFGGTLQQAVDQGSGYEYENGAVYYGAISNGQPADGQGTMIYPTGNRYEGDYQNGQRQGCGTFTFANGRQYIGQFEADQFSGRGTWIIENGERYIGHFKNNQCSGEGTFIFANGSTKSGIWADGKLPGSQLSCDRGSLSLPSSQDM